MATCNLCELRGGALVETRDDCGLRSYTHMICAIINNETEFYDPSKRKLVNLDVNKQNLYKNDRKRSKSKSCSPIVNNLE